jgi:DNA-binding NarL/FixJ family response regulator
MRMLIVDDQLLFRNGLVSLLNSYPQYDIVGEAGSVSEAIQKAMELKPDLILMDFSLPDGTGLEATQAILTKLPDCKIVFLTMYETDEKLFAAMRSGAKGYMAKNISISKMLATLQALDRGEMALSPDMTSRILTEFAHSPHLDKSKEDPIGRLSERELEVLREVAKGLSNQEIAQRLYLAENTVKHHVHNILYKLGLENRRQAAKYARLHGFGPQIDES